MHKTANYPLESLGAFNPVWQVIMHAFVHVFDNNIYQRLHIKPQSKEANDKLQTKFIMPPLCIPQPLPFLIPPVSLI